MKKNLLKFSLIAILSLLSRLGYATNVESWIKPNTQEIQGFVVTPELKKSMNQNIDMFLSLTPKKFTELTGKKLSFVQVMKLKAAQKYVRKHFKAGDAGVPKGVYIILAFLGWAWIIMGIKDDWTGNNWWVNLLLVLLCWLPGFIHALVKMKEYYN